MKYNYPVKYTAMPIIEQVGWSRGGNELERNYNVVCYIVSKCYLISDRTKYKENGKSEKEYEVVFPYQNSQNHNVWERNVPSFNNGCTNSEYVEKVFDTYDDALKFVTEKNKELYNNELKTLPNRNNLNDQVSKKRQEFSDRLSKYKQLEQQILSNTRGLEQSSVKELDKIIINNKGKMKVLHSNLYEYLNYATCSDFIVYSLPQEQYSELLESINKKDLTNAHCDFNADPILYYDHNANKNNIMVINKDGDILYRINEWGSLISNELQHLPSIKLSTLDDEVVRSFTTETLEDIMLSFNRNKYVKLDENQGPTLKKVISNKNRK